VYRETRIEASVTDIGSVTMGSMQPRVLALVLVAAGSLACGSTADDTAQQDEGTGGVASGTGGGGGGGSATGGARADAGIGGTRSTGGALGTGGKAGTGGTTGIGGTTGTGGKSGTGGATGTGGGGTREAGPASPCNGLPAAGTWDNILPAGVIESDAIVVDPFDAATVWLGGRDHGVYKSTDCAATWTHVNTGRNGSALDVGSLGSMAVDPVNQGVMYTTAAMGAMGLFRSTNSGVDWDQLFPTGSEVATVVEYNWISNVGMAAADPRHLVVSMHANCKAPYGPICEAESTDAGATWKIVTVECASGGCGGGWIAGAGAFILDASSWLFSTYSAGLWLTTDHGGTWKNVTPTGAWGSTSGKTISLPFAPSDTTGTYYLADMQGVIKSSDGRTWSFIPNSGGRSVGLALGSGHVYTADQWSTNYHVATESDLTTWTVVPPPAALPADQGAPYLAYDAAHHLLYSSNWAGGLWRLVTP
jgi:hypothetical protein